jgi:hypothetical protein
LEWFSVAKSQSEFGIDCQVLAAIRFVSHLLNYYLVSKNNLRVIQGQVVQSVLLPGNFFRDRSLIRKNLVRKNASINLTNDWLMLYHYHNIELQLPLEDF